MSPVYEFECVGCHTQKDVEASIFDKIPAPTCIYCGSPMYRIYSVPAVQFNAQGFYKTDNGG